jgi:hypothetical protein
MDAGAVLIVNINRYLHNNHSIACDPPTPPLYWLYIGFMLAYGR